MADSVAPQSLGAEETRVLRREAAKQRLEALGLTAKAWAAANGYRPKTVYKVIRGELKAKYGIGHEIAVALGIKDPDDHA